MHMLPFAYTSALQAQPVCKRSLRQHIHCIHTIYNTVQYNTVQYNTACTIPEKIHFELYNSIYTIYIYIQYNNTNTHAHTIHTYTHTHSLQVPVRYRFLSRALIAPVSPVGSEQYNTVDTPWFWRTHTTGLSFRPIVPQQDRFSRTLQGYTAHKCHSWSFHPDSPFLTLTVCTSHVSLISQRTLIITSKRVHIAVV